MNTTVNVVMRDVEGDYTFADSTFDVDQRNNLTVKYEGERIAYFPYLAYKVVYITTN